MCVCVSCVASCVGTRVQGLPPRSDVNAGVGCGPRAVRNRSLVRTTAPTARHADAGCVLTAPCSRSLVMTGQAFSSDGTTSGLTGAGAHLDAARMALASAAGGAGAAHTVLRARLKSDVRGSVLGRVSRRGSASRTEGAKLAQRIADFAAPINTHVLGVVMNALVGRNVPPSLRPVLWRHRLCPPKLVQMVHKVRAAARAETVSWFPWGAWLAALNATAGLGCTGHCFQHAHP